MSLESEIKSLATEVKALRGVITEMRSNQLTLPTTAPAEETSTVGTTAPAPKAKAEPEPEPERSDGPSEAEFQQAFVTLYGKNVQKATELLSDFKVSRLGEIPAEKRQEAFDWMQEQLDA